MCGSDHPVRVYLSDNDLLMCQICCHNKTRQSRCVKQCKKILLQDTIFPYSPLNMRELKQQRGYFKPICSQGALIFVEFPFPFHLSDPVRLIQVSGQWSIDCAERPLGPKFEKTYLSIMTIIILCNGQIIIYLYWWWREWEGGDWNRCLSSWWIPFRHSPLKEA